MPGSRLELGFGGETPEGCPGVDSSGASSSMVAREDGLFGRRLGDRRRQRLEDLLAMLWSTPG
jgi:hypothetical protein